MSTTVRVVLVTLIFAVIGFLFGANAPLGALIWPPAPGGPEPVGLQVPLFVLLSVSEALAFGLGIAFLIFGLPFVRRLAPNAGGWHWVAFASIFWLLVSWLPHDNLHIHNGEDLAGLLMLEYGFHVTLMVAGGLLAWFFVRALRERAALAVGEPQLLRAEKEHKRAA